MDYIASKPSSIRLGIDLGTSNSGGIFLKGQNLTAVNDNGKDLIPSVVQFKNGKEIIGKAAKDAIGRKNAAVVFNTKRIIGRRFDDPEVKEVMDNCGSTIVNRGGAPFFQIKGTDKELSPIDIGTKIVKYIVDKAEKQAEAKVDRLCITVPAHFNENQRTATCRCALNCGFTADQISILNEPTAAALCYVIDNNVKEGYFLVYDLGGGTFDVSIVHFHDNNFDVKAYGGDNALGGVDFDRAMVQLICRKYKRIYNQDLLDPNDREVYNRCYRKLLAQAEAAKIDLTLSLSTQVSLQNISGFQDQGGDEIELTILRSELDDLIAPLIDKTIQVTKETLTKSGVKESQILKVIRVGGSSRIPLVETKLAACFTKDKVASSVDIDKCVAQGACMSLTRSDISMKEIIAYSLGQLVEGNKIQCVIPEGTILPAEDSVFNYTTRNDQQKVNTALFQGHAAKKGDEEDVDTCVKLQDYMYTGFQKGYAGSVEFKTTFYIEKSGIVYVTVKETSTGKILLNRKQLEWE